MNKDEILTLLKKEKLTAKQIARRLKGKISTANTFLGRMRLYGLVRRTIIEDYKEQGGRRSYLYDITESGLKRLIWYREQKEGAKKGG